ncbi:alcohol oxidase [Irpex rosettiformis]|uniref:Alcohol oxidase n=1 Tax=Irpex rosettiformis TaxID=378272 RepID=A0ACB8TXM7_9APHY|nr:alcohol oxidase [Irpex rosettiformis]
MVSSIAWLSSLLVLAKATSADGSHACRPPSSDPAAFAKHEFDYVIIGGGVGGLTVASRLAEDPSVRVGVIEAGDYHPSEPLIDIPQNIGLLVGNPEYDWAFSSVPQSGLNGLKVAVARGKMLGGSSGLNFLAWNRASKPEYDAWSPFASEHGWDFDGLLPYFERSTTIRPHQLNPFPGINGTQEHAVYDAEFMGGPIQLSYNDIYIDTVFPFVESLNSLGVPTNPDGDNGRSAGVINTRSSIDRSKGVRSYSTEYYCRSASQSNFHVLTGAHVTQILLHPDNHLKGSFAASGVKFVVNSSEYTVKAKKEVILSAGVIQSPQLLELSGIGNATLLKSLGVTPLIDLPGVGENLQDHLATAVEYELKPGARSFDELRINNTFKAEQSAIYNASHTGILAAIDPAMAYIPFHTILDTTQVENMLKLSDETVPVEGTLQPLQHKIQRQWMEDATIPQVEMILFSNGQIPPLANASYITIVCENLHPLARGSVHINSTLPSDYPLINHQYLSNEFDVQTMLTVLKLALKLQDTPPLSDIIQTRVYPPPGALSDDDLINYLRTIALSAAHPAGTVAMAPQSLGGVVGSDLKVHGTTNLRVVDASIMPILVGAHIQATTYAIAEKAADIIKSQLQAH